MKPKTRMMFGVLLFFANLLLGVAVFAQATPAPYGDGFARGNAAFAEQRYADAAQAYEEFAAEHGESSAVMLNLGNAWLQSGDHGRAIAAYERGLVLAPRDSDLRANLETARRAAGVAAGERWHSAAKWLSLGEWGALLLFGGLASALLLLLRGMRPERPRRGSRAALAAALAVMTLAGGGLWLQAAQLDRAIVVGDAASLLVSPAAGAESVAEVRPGAAVQIEQAHGEYRLVRDSDGRAGWLVTEALAPVYGR